MTNAATALKIQNLKIQLKAAKETLKMFPVGTSTYRVQAGKVAKLEIQIEWLETH